jgi:hypothetical protein
LKLFEPWLVYSPGEKRPEIKTIPVIVLAAESRRKNVLHIAAGPPVQMSLAN